VERALAGAHTAPSAVLAVHWLVVADAVTGLGLRASWDPAGTDLLPTQAEWEARQRAEAEERVKELEAELKRMRG
jgi:hypothetical protein